MPNLINSITVGAFVREGRDAAGLTQTQLADRIGASRFWVAAFEKGKPGAALGLALKAIHALGMTLQIGPAGDAPADETTAKAGATPARAIGDTSLAAVIARATLTHPARSKVVAWPTAATTHRKSGEIPAKRKPGRKA